MDQEPQNVLSVTEAGTDRMPWRTPGTHRFPHGSQRVFERLDPRVTVEAILSSLRQALDDRVRLCLDAAADAGLVEVHSNQFEAAIRNLVVNASNAMPAGGELHVAICSEQLAVPLATAHGTVAPGSYVTIRVRDTGVGMSDAELRWAFAPFFATRVPWSGVGLGLSIVRRLVDEVGGHASMRRPLEGGTEVCVRLPRVAEATPDIPVPSAAPLRDGESAPVSTAALPSGAASSPGSAPGSTAASPADHASTPVSAPAAVADSAPGSASGSAPGSAPGSAAESAPGAGSATAPALLPGAAPAAAAPPAVASPAATTASREATERRQEAVLLVDDDDNVRTVTTELLKSLGYRVDAVADAESAFDMLETPDPHDLLLCDMMLADGASGADVAHEVVARRPGIKVVFMSGYGADDLRDRLGGFSAFPPLRKPFRMKELAERLRRELDESIT